MASSKEYLDYILDCLSGLDEITTRKMMGEYMIYFRSKLPESFPMRGQSRCSLWKMQRTGLLYHSCSIPFTASFPHQSSGRKRIKKGG